jgi:hypothetical protein
MISSSCNSPRTIWVPKYLLIKLEGPNKAWVPNLLDQIVGGLRCIGNLTIKKDDTNWYIVKSMNYYTNIDVMQISRLR